MTAVNRRATKDMNAATPTQMAVITAVAAETYASSAAETTMQQASPDRMESDIVMKATNPSQPDQVLGRRLLMWGCQKLLSIELVVRKSSASCASAILVEAGNSAVYGILARDRLQLATRLSRRITHSGSMSAALGSIAILVRLSAINAIRSISKSP
eukprot:CAMPEP_0117665442 /NCGR_PEP_ID=MMETSP0804-20121206/9811_1 /TAXON_ID=1074897 /ORGANISM="Tetraselmis astigmatica, Strain CCMP880" /LENGTH=156 /DNA_ID=CAMNT_0005472853 /DNA_START=398 /DNA_END=868 /DNA_ORIENTATION=-